MLFTINYSCCRAWGNNFIFNGAVFVPPMRRCLKICEEMNYRLPYISAKFKKETGITVTKFLQNKRIEQSCRYLAETSLSISQIAENVGYTDIKFFNKVFKQVTKITPREYRKQNK